MALDKSRGTPGTAENGSMRHEDREVLRQRHEAFVRALVTDGPDGLEGLCSTHVRAARMALFRKRMRGLRRHCPGAHRECVGDSRAHEVSSRLALCQSWANKS